MQLNPSEGSLFSILLVVCYLSLPLVLSADCTLAVSISLSDPTLGPLVVYSVIQMETLRNVKAFKKAFRQSTMKPNA